MIWSHDGSRVVLNSFGMEHLDLLEAPSKSAGPHTTLLKDGVAKWPVSWSRDDRFVLYVTNSRDTSNDIWVLPLTGDRQPYAYLRTEASENWATFSPDGKWVAFSSTMSGRSKCACVAVPVHGTSLARVGRRGQPGTLAARRERDLLPGSRSKGGRRVGGDHRYRVHRQGLRAALRDPSSVRRRCSRLRRHRRRHSLPREHARRQVPPRQRSSPISPQSK